MTEAIKARIAQVQRGELPDGYRRTKAGIIPDDWEIKRFGDVFRFIPNNTCARALMTVSGGEIRNVHYGDVLIKYHSIIDCGANDLPFLTDEAKTSPAMLLQNGDIIIADTAEDLTAGKAVEIVNIGNDKVVSGLHTMACRPVENRFAPKWLGYYMDSDAYHNQLIPLIRGAKVSSVSKGEIVHTTIAIPPLAEQRKIAAVLSAQDTIITLTERLITEKQRQKQYLAREFFHSRISCRVPLSQLAKITMGQSPNSEHYNTAYDGMPLIQGNADIRNRKPAPRMYTTEVRKQCRKGDILLSVRAPVGTVARSDIKACIGRGICAIDGGGRTEYLCQYLFYFENKWGAVAQGSTFEAISGSDIANLRVPVSDRVEKVSEILSTADREIELLRRRLEQEQRRKTALSQLLLTGLVRV